MIINALKKIFTLALLFPPIFLCAADDNALWLTYSQYQSDYFADGNSSIEPTGFNLGYSRIFNDDWQVALSYGETEGEGRWPLEDITLNNPFNAAKSESSNASILIGWSGEDYALSGSYSEIESEDLAVTRAPLTYEHTIAKDRVFVLSLDRYLVSSDWLFAWTLGAQYVQSDLDSFETIFVDPVVSIRTILDQTSWSLFTQLGVSREYDKGSFSWSPQISFGWDWEISNQGDPFILITRGDVRRRVSQYNSRFANGYRTPDTGNWELSVTFDWHNDWRSNIGYTRTISAPIETSSVNLEISLDF